MYICDDYFAMTTYNMNIPITISLCVTPDHGFARCFTPATPCPRVSISIIIQFINMYQFTAANPQGQAEMWTATENWINKQKDTRIILQGDLNSAHPGGRWDYAQPLNKDIGMADKKLDQFIKSTNGNFYAQQEHTWKGKNAERH